MDYRDVLSPLCQALFTSLIGAGVAYAATSSRRRGYWAVGLGWLVAVTLHAVWIYAVAAGVSRLALACAALYAIVVVLLVAVVMDRRRIIAFLRRYLPEYEPAGIIAAPDVAMLGSLRDRCQARQWARLYCGLAGLRQMSEYQLAATELGLLRRGPSAVSSTMFRSPGSAMGCWLSLKTATSGLVGRLAGPPRPPWAPHGPSCFRPLPARRAPPASRPDRPSAQPGRLDA